ncbi:MAG: hypothetical protein U0941_04870 [Planctomycetaceae bacterium]
MITLFIRSHGFVFILFFCGCLGASDPYEKIVSHYLPDEPITIVKRYGTTASDPPLIEFLASSKENVECALDEASRVIAGMSQSQASAVPFGKMESAIAWLGRLKKRREHVIQAQDMIPFVAYRMTYLWAGRSYDSLFFIRNGAVISVEDVIPGDDSESLYTDFVKRRFDP